MYWWILMDSIWLKAYFKVGIIVSLDSWFYGVKAL